MDDFYIEWLFFYLFLFFIVDSYCSFPIILIGGFYYLLFLYYFLFLSSFQKIVLTGTKGNNYKFKSKSFQSNINL
jgi:hypothetical protein